MLRPSSLPAPLVLFGLLALSPDPAGAAPALEIEAATFDAGSVDRGTLVRHAFTLRNTGDAPLSIHAKPG